MRVKNSIRNISAGIGSQFIITLLSFVSRTVFIGALGIEYLGINGLFSNILGMLALAEAGIGSSIIYSLYKPVAENNEEKIIVLMNLYKKCFRIIAIVVFLLGISLMPFLNFFMNDTNIQHVNIIFFIFLLNTVSTYLFSHKISLLNVSQKGYIVTGVYSISSIISTCIKIGILYFLHDYLLYIIVDILITITTSVILSLIVDKMYPYIKNKVSSQLDPETKSSIIRNVKALVLHNIGGYCVFGTDNIIISSFVSVAAVGLYSNYYMFINICRTFINQIFDNINHSLGNLVAQESDDKIYKIFRVTMFFNFWIYSFFTIFLFIMLDPIITLWLGHDFQMSKSAVIFIMLNFFISGMRKSIVLVKTTSGIFHQDRYAPFFEAGVNLVLSIILVQYFGMTGVFIGTLISTIVVPFWTAPYFVYKEVFRKPVLEYFKIYLGYVVIGVGIWIVTNVLCSYVPVNNFVMLVVRSIICFIVPNICYVLIFRKTDECKYIFTIMHKLILGIRVKFNLDNKSAIKENI
ncbi:lipopolysaccharide biosynthesis protein [Paenibacillus sp. Soil750]|uniref:lipopolysaccharide biosynthesis protein n=1 Tax=Paenibacillus sp. Soil750 TaxID=1736398 RepID=UPI0006FD95A2|nr:oligosaccharide flippase family protein [Paenibacillus sp. Soil750]KRE75540.1 flippase [Paenibacillus sp. Soil750]